MGSSYANLLRTPIFLVNTTAPNLNSTAVTLTTASALPPLPERSSINLQPLSIPFTWQLNIPGKFPTLLWLFQASKFVLKATVYAIAFYYKPSDSRSYLLYTSSPPSHVKNSIPFPQFLRLRRLCSDDSDLSEKSVAMCQIFAKRGFPVSIF